MLLTDILLELKVDGVKRKVIAVYPGRFNPFGPHHKKVYEALLTKFDKVFISTSNKVDKNSPLDFKEKVKHLIKMGVPKNRIALEKSPYIAKSVTERYDPKKYAIVYILGEKDASRLKPGVKKSGEKSYFQHFDDSALEGHNVHGYVYKVPHVSVKFGEKELSGTEIRKHLKTKEDFKRIFGYFDEHIYGNMIKKFNEGEIKPLTPYLNEDLIIEFIAENDIASILKEATETTLAPVDDGPPTFYKSFTEYKTQSSAWIKSMYEDVGWKLVQYILSTGAEDPEIDYTMSYNIVPAVAYGKSGDGQGYANPVQKYKNQMRDVLAPLGWRVVTWLGVKDRTTTGVDVEAPELPGADGDTGNTDDILRKLGLHEEVNKEVSGVLEDKLLLEGGSFGHLQHPFDNKNLTFGDFKRIITLGLSGRLDVEGDVAEKTDGQALAISWKNNKLIAARNKGDRKNFGENALDLNGMVSKFSGRGDIKDAFVFAMKDLQKAISGLSDKQKQKIFAEGEKFMNLEVIWPASANVINYDKAVLQFHGSTRFDKLGNPIEYIKSDARVLEGMIRQINQHIQSKYKIIKPQILTVPKHQDFTKKRKYFLSILNKLQKQYNLSDKDSFGLYHQKFWEEFIYNSAKQNKYQIPYGILVKLTKRWAFFDKSYTIPQMKKTIQNEKFLEWALTFDKTDHKKYVKQNILPFEKLFFELGTEILSNMSGFLTANPEIAVQKIKKDVDNTIKQIQSGGDPKKIELLTQQLEKINSYGGLEKIVPSEGITFLYKGELFKITGNYSSLNQIIGMLKFNR